MTSKNIKKESSFDEDDFDRKKVSIKLIELLIRDIDISPIVINGEWGTGKTIFCKKTTDLIEKNYKDVIECTYIDAFSADHANEPLLTIIAAIAKLINKSPRKQEFLKAAKAVACYSIKAFGKAGISWMLRTDTNNLTGEILDVVKTATADSIDYLLDKLIIEHEKVEENIDSLKKILLGITETKPLIIFVDELDRCKPTFAVSMLEIIKHVFDIPGIKFVLISNFKQLMASIKNCYGNEVNAHQYLEKFIKYSFELPAVVKVGPNSTYVSCLHANNLISNNELFNSGIWKHSLEFIKQLIEQNGLSLREVETFIRYCSIYIIMSEGSPNRFSIMFVLTIFLIFIYAYVPSIKEKIQKRKITAADLCQLLGITEYLKSENIPGVSHSQALSAYIIITFNDGSIENFDFEDTDALDNWNRHLNQRITSGEHALSNFFKYADQEFNKLMFKI
ncbi:hypothetical protein B1207_07545 [Legionella quinlivanii]|uniref:KAP NTPase domain-containing protein n=1 Tax=Legionella quinlivanii TaxID=45073 RepID=A0A364LJG5_9GAMM|nr:P-loop NTPase fold protein [Legionella quinlivanii]RAP36650.1 hypothetical protein B1207_07545 [Legionella quinlivanii]